MIAAVCNPHPTSKDTLQPGKVTNRSPSSKASQPMKWAFSALIHGCCCTLHFGELNPSINDATFLLSKIAAQNERNETWAKQLRMASQFTIGLNLSQLSAPASGDSAILSTPISSLSSFSRWIIPSKFPGPKYLVIVQERRIFVVRRRIMASTGCADKLV